ncbi:MAG: hypothetical protein NTV79_02380 [Candidatus Aureabacteria bacterium]|nr:hypothetical protein [Candidatus Auribacterota bacterium]
MKGEDPEWNRAAARRLGDEIKAGLNRVREAIAAARGDNELLRRFSLDRPFNFTDRQAREAFGESSSLGKIKLSKVGSNQENDRFGITFARYNDQGVHFIFRRGETIGVFAFEPFAGDMYGVKIGDPKEAVLDTLRRRCGIKKPGNPTKNWWVDLPDREIELIFTDARLSGIQVHKKDPLGRRYRWVGY